MPSPEASVRRVSVQSQVSPVPLILTSLRTTQHKGQSSMSQLSRSNSGHSSKRDSVASHYQRGTLKRASHSAGVDGGSGPLYRLYPSSQSVTGLDFKAMGIHIPERPQTSASFHHGSDSSGVETAVYHNSSSDEASEGKSVATYQPKGMQGQPRFQRSKFQDGSERPFSPYVSDMDAPRSPMGDYPDHEAPTPNRLRYDSARPSRDGAYSSRSMTKSPSRAPSREHNVASSQHSRNVSKAASFSQRPVSPLSPVATDYAYEHGERSSAESVYSHHTAATSIHTLPPLQTKGPENVDAQRLDPVLEDDPRSFDLLSPISSEENVVGTYLLERRADLLMSAEHLHMIFDDPKLLLKFTGFLNAHRPRSIPVLIYYLDALKALRAINYANAIAEALEPIRGWTFTEQIAHPTTNNILRQKADQAFEALVQEDLPAYIAHTWTEVVSVSIQRRITGTLAPHLREQSEGLAEVFCLTDPSRTDCPIVFCSEEFARTTQYGMNYAIGRNCRFLQGPRTNANSVRRLAIASTEGRELTEVLINYRRDGSPFMNLLMTAPLMDSRGQVRYYIGAQVDVSNLVRECTELQGLAKLLEKEQGAEEEEEATKKDEFQHLCEMFNGAELETVRRHGGRMHKEYSDDSEVESISDRRRVLLKDPTQEAIEQQSEASAAMTNTSIASAKLRANGRLAGIYQHYLLVRPAPSLRILFTSPSLRVPGISQSSFLARIGGSPRVRADLAAALGEARGVTAKIRWLTKADEHGEGEGRPRWIHCTPLLGHSGAVGVWMIVLVDDENPRAMESTGRKFRPAPPVATTIGGKNWDRSQHAARKLQDASERSPLVQDFSEEFFPASALPRRKSIQAVSRGSSRGGPGMNSDTAVNELAPSRLQYTYGDGL